MSRKLTKVEFIEKLTPEQREKYDFSLFEYISSTTKSTVICPEHGKFDIRPGNMIAGQGCRACGYVVVGKKVAAFRFMDTSNITEKPCSECGETKPLAEFGVQDRGFCGRRSKCKVCSQEYVRHKSLIGTELKMVKTHKFCNSCQSCLEIDSFRIFLRKGVEKFYHLCKECERIKGGEVRVAKGEYFYSYRERNRDKAKANSRIFYSDNKERYKQLAKDYSKLTPINRKFHDQLPLEDGAKEDQEGRLLVLCKHCRKYFHPTNSQYKSRICAINGSNRGEGNFYCSERCKELCDVYRTVKLRKSERKQAQAARTCQTKVREVLKQIQCGDFGYVYCERCADIIDVELHHTVEVAKGGDINNPAGHMMLCTRCHDILHAGCK